MELMKLISENPDLFIKLGFVGLKEELIPELLESGSVSLLWTLLCSLGMYCEICGFGSGKGLLISV